MISGGGTCRSMGHRLPSAGAGSNGPPHDGMPATRRAMDFAIMDGAAAPFLRGKNPLATRVEVRNGIPVLPGAYPLIGHLPAVMVDELGLVREAARTLGPVFYISRGYQDWNILYAGRDAFSLFKNRALDSSYRREGPLRALFGDGLIAHDGPVHQHLRAAMNGPFQPKGLGEAGVGPLVSGIVGGAVRGWVGRRRVRVLAETRELALRTMFRLVGVEEGELSEWRKRYEQLMLMALALPHDI